MRRRFPSSNDFVCVGWNARGVPLGSAVSTLNILEEEFHWAVLLIQEFTDHASPPSEVAGHLILCEPSIGGQRRRAGVVVHRDYPVGLQGPSVFHLHSLAQALRAPTGDLSWLVVSHLDTRRAKHYYQATLDALEELFNLAPPNNNIIS